MRVFGLWHGGNGHYSPGDIATDAESWRSLTDAKRSLVDRYECGSQRRDYRARTVNVDDDGTATLGVPDDSLRPCVGDDTTIDLYPAEKIGRGKWRIGHEPYARLSLGPRKGVRVESF